MILVHQIQPGIEGSKEANISSVVLDCPGDREAKFRYMSNTMHKRERKTACIIVQVVYCIIMVAPRDWFMEHRDLDETSQNCSFPFLFNFLLTKANFFFLPSKLSVSI